MAATPKLPVPVVLLTPTSGPAFSIFNSNDWQGASRPVITSCAAQLSLLLYVISLLPAVRQEAEAICRDRFDELQRQWAQSTWPLDGCSYLVEVPSLHLQVQAFSAAIKTLLDLLAQLANTQGIVKAKIDGFHKQRSEIGGRFLQVLESNVPLRLAEVAESVRVLIANEKAAWIDTAVGLRDVLSHPDTGAALTMCCLILAEDDSRLQLERIEFPSVENQPFFSYAEKTVEHVEDFCKRYLDLVRVA